MDEIEKNKSIKKIIKKIAIKRNATKFKIKIKLKQFRDGIENNKLIKKMIQYKTNIN